MKVSRREKNSCMSLERLPIGPFVAGDQGDFLYIKIGANTYCVIFDDGHTVEMRTTAEMKRRVTPDITSYKPVSLARIETEYV